MTAELADKVALVTGGARRIGASIVRILHAQGMKVVVHYRGSADAAHILQRELNETRPDSIVLVRGDLSDIAKAKHLVRETVEQFKRLDVLVNNASMFTEQALENATENDWDQLFTTNAKVPFFISQAAASSLKQTNGCIVNIADIYAERPLIRHAIYCATKAALLSMTRSFAIELGPEVRVNAVAPGAILWPESNNDQVAQQRIVSRTPLKRSGSADDIARAVLYLVKDAPFVSGDLIRVDGGRSVVP
ncbi:MAG: pteridine reductase [Gammaproteobacteria bacterium]|nr:pteridine reductase [Gammaproteobacteria bacterium]